MTPIGHFGIILREDVRRALFPIVEDPDVAEAAERLIEGGRSLFSSSSRGAAIVDGSTGGDEVARHTIGSACAAAAMGMTMGHDLLIRAAGLAVHRLTGERHFLILARKEGQGYVTELETDRNVHDEASARRSLDRHPAVRAHEMARTFTEAVVAMREGGRTERDGGR